MIVCKDGSMMSPVPVTALPVNLFLAAGNLCNIFIYFILVLFKVWKYNNLLILFSVFVLGCSDSTDSYPYIQSNTKFRKRCELCTGRWTPILSEK